MTQTTLHNEYGEALTADTCCLCGLNLRDRAHKVEEGENSVNPVGTMQVNLYTHGAPPCVCHGCDRTFCQLCATEEWDGGDANSWRCSECNDPATKAKREAIRAFKDAEAAGQQALFLNSKQEGK